MSLQMRQLRSTHANSENAALQAKAGGMMQKPGAAVPGKNVRAALGNIGLNTQRSTRTNVAATKEMVKPVRAGLTKQKATSALQSLKQTLVPVIQQNVARPSLDRKAKRASVERAMLKQQEEPMETEEVEAGDVEMSEEAVVSGGPVEDIDREDAGNQQMLPDYVNEIYAYLRILEVRQAVMKGYLGSESSKNGIKPRMRNFLVDWLVEVHQQFSLIQETLYLTIAILDRYLQVEGGHTTTKQLQLVGVSAMLVAAKYEEMYPPEIGDFVYITDKAYKESEIRTMEIAIIKALNFDLGRPLPINFLRRCSKAGLVDEHVHGLAKYLMELTIVDYKMAHVEPSRIAAASLALSMRLLDPVQSSLRHLWTPTLVHYTSYSLAQIEEPIRAIADSLHTIHHVQGINITHLSGTSSTGKKVKAMRAITKKYCGKKYSKVASMKVVNGDEGKDCLKRIVAGEF